jgi:hypothetical protein
MKSFLNKCRRSVLTDGTTETIPHGDLRLLVLHVVLSEGPMARPEIERRIAERLARAGAECAPVDLVIDMLEHLDYLRSFTHGQAYGITEDGITLLDANRTMLTALLSQHGFAPSASDDAEAAVMQSLDGLGLALRLSLVAGRLSRRQARRVARTLDALTVRIELA